MRHLRSFTVTLILLLVLPMRLFAGTVESGGGGFGGGGGAGDASFAEQQTQTGLLTTIDADTGTIAGAVKAEDSAHSSGDSGIPFLGVRSDGAVSSLSNTNGDYTPVAVDSTGKLFISTLNTISGAVVPGTSATHLGKAEDAAHTTGDTGVAILTKRTDTAASSADTDGDYATLNSDANGALWTTNSAIEGTRLRATLYDSGGNEIVVPTAGLTHYAAATASTNCTSVEASSGTVYHYSLTNTTSTIYYLRMYNLASAPTASSATGFVESIPIPANTSGGGRERPMNIGQAFTTGIAYCITGGASSTDNTNAAAGVFVSILYKP